MSNIDKQALREELSNPAIGSKDHLRKLALSLLDELEHYKSREERVTKLVLDNSTSWDDHYEQSRVTVVDVSDPDVLALLDENIQLHRGKDAIEAVALALRDDMRQAREQLEAAEKLVQERNALAAENTALKKSEVEFNEYCRRECEDVGDTWVDDFTETPATDAFLAEVRASARNEGINYAASRLAAAFNHGFLDKPVSEVLDVTRMILSAKEDLANDPLPADDGLSGEYAEKAIEEWADQLRKGAAL
ncbi:ead/Ea22-like family protein [Salmonella enterica]|nr:ead/Ea22-like family protein [Salmonella enterica subsp. enterica serovar Cerro]EKL4397291.1 ead/Ea22-like family protein [Salmonella enterica]